MSFIGPNWIGQCQEKIICVQGTSTFLRKSILHSVVALEWWETLVSASSFLEYRVTIYALYFKNEIVQIVKCWFILYFLLRHAIQGYVKSVISFFNSPK